MLTNHIKKVILLLIAIAPLEASMHHAQPFNYGTRFERKGLFTVHGWGAYGNTQWGKDSTQTKQNVLGIYGVHKMHQVGKNVVNSNLSLINAAVLSNLWHVVPTDAAYATLAFTGTMYYKGGEVSVAMNISDEFFVGADIPFDSFEMKDPTFVDLTPTDAKNAEWIQFLAHFDSILTDVGLEKTATKSSGIGDVSLYTGWTRNIDDLENLDFIDTTLRLGVILGTAEKKDGKKAFSIAPGHDKHTGAFISFDTALGTNQWFTFGFHLSQLFLFKKDTLTRVQSALGQNGFIKLAQTEVSCAPGSLYTVGGFLKADYAFLGAAVGYTYTHKNKTTLTTKNSALYDPTIVNADEMLQEWSTHTLQVMVECELDDETNRAHPKLGLFYNYVIQAKRAFLNHTMGGLAGVSLTYDF